MPGHRKRMRTLEEERRVRTLQTIGLAIVLLVTLVLVWMAMHTA